MIKKKKKKKVVGDSVYKTNVDKVREKFEKEGGDQRWFKAKPNATSIIRVCPPWGKSADGSFYLHGGLHYGFSIGGRQRALWCNRIDEKTDEGCPVCAVVDIAREQGGDENDSFVNRIRVRKKWWVNVVERKTNKIYMFGGNKKFIDLVIGAIDDEDYGDITDPKHGHDIKIKRTGATMTDTRYDYTIRPMESSIGVDDWKNVMYNLALEIPEVMTESELWEHLSSNFGDILEELGMNKPKKKAKKHAKHKKVKEEPEESEEEEEEDDEEEDEEDDDEEDD